jgi:hypothetical protein
LGAGNHLEKQQRIFQATTGTTNILGTTIAVGRATKAQRGLASEKEQATQAETHQENVNKESRPT